LADWQHLRSDGCPAIIISLLYIYLYSCSSCFKSMLSSTTTKPRSYSPATVTELATLTTPFLQPPGCESHWTLTSAPISLPANELRGNSSSTPISTYSVLLVSKHVASCHPSGWDRILPPRVDTLHFYPGVCPSAWTYYSMAAPSSQALSSTAFCCNRSISPPPSEIRTCH